MATRLKIFLPFGLLILSVLIVPVSVMLISSLQNMDGGFSFSNYHQIFFSRYYRGAIYNSISISLITSLISLVISIIGAWALTKLSLSTKNILITVFNMSSSFAGVPLAFSLIILFGNAGVFKAITSTLHVHDALNIYSVTGMTFAYTFFEIPLGIMFFFPVLDSLSREWFEVSDVLGASKMFFISKVIFPIILPNIVEIFVLLFANAMGTYETVYALMGNNLVSIPTVIGSLINGELVANVPLACAFATLFTVIMTIIVWLGNRVTNIKGRRIS
ncbi:ABC transporter permease subunit [Liquorilactobacillus mali]|uniref:ABC transporter permease n=1 Tax=Liquorilactobacillus mali TaxID=1618 RepID=UPI00264E7354|nr:ABC transporter permease subunit [Liquorilactobacillus mali]MDN7146086.1 ABC transporter permease subunit [Liquorilactobacillus mali]